MESNLNFYDAWRFLTEHQIFKDEYSGSHFVIGLDIEVVKVNPKNSTIEDDETLNSKVEVWLEAGPYVKEDRQCSHDIDLDCGADTFENAIVQLATLVKNKYGDTIFA